jgi:hypothetical protein
MCFSEWGKCQTYRITKTADNAQAVLYLLLDAQDKPIGAFFRPLYDGTNAALTQVVYNLKAVVDNGDGSYTINTLGNGGSDTVPLFKAFKHSTHSGTISWVDENLPYDATRL